MAPRRRRWGVKSHPSGSSAGITLDPDATIRQDPPDCCDSMTVGLAGDQADSHRTHHKVSSTEPFGVKSYDVV